MDVVHCISIVFNLLYFCKLISEQNTTEQNRIGQNSAEQKKVEENRIETY